MHTKEQEHGPGTTECPRSGIPTTLPPTHDAKRPRMRNTNEMCCPAGSVAATAIVTVTAIVTTATATVAATATALTIINRTEGRH
mmetsp:Transcript_13821/g.24678  ORF Transcript_13821/g.24678 Transcript_13821/m.24678 type:complete len:85 (+) Transcript_13821:80-334(+)